MKLYMAVTPDRFELPVMVEDSLSRLAGRCNPVLGREIILKRGNVYYDVRVARTIPARGLYPEERRISITKGVRLLDKGCSITICEVIAQTQRAEIQRREEMRRHHELFSDPTMTVTVENIRAERQETRDLMQDLRDIAEGVEVVHQSDSLKKAKEQKRERREKARKDRKAKLSQKIADGTLDGRDRHRIQKLFSPAEILRIKKEAAQKDKGEQLSLW